MKKAISLALFAGMIIFFSCGPSKEELKKKEKRKLDSIQHYNDSVALEDMKKEQAKADSVQKAENEKMKRMADSLHEDSVKRKLIRKKK